MAPEIPWIQNLHAIGPDENPHARLLGTVEILGKSFHVNCEQVHDVENKDINSTNCGEMLQTTVLPEHDTYAPEVWQLTDGACDTVTIDGREYILVISPYQR